MLRLRSLTPVTYLCKLLGIHSLAAFLQLELFRVYSRLFFTASSRRIYSPGPSPAPVLTTAFCF
ncbi:hypothetical protein CYQ92_08875 [Escherichia coli]|nr:hypothetical protein CYQ92_08875 [Escherichia coli]